MKAAWRWNFTVRSLMPSVRAICLLGSPSRTRRRTWRSPVRQRGAGGAGKTGLRQDAGAELRFQVGAAGVERPDGAGNLGATGAPFSR